MEKVLDELQSVDGEMDGLIDQINRLLKRYDFEGIQKIVEQISLQ
jgi:hypothetical protein